MAPVVVASTHINSLDYDADTFTLVVEFNDGSQYSYGMVPPARFEELLGATSVGRAFHQLIKGRYAAVKL